MKYEIGSKVCISIDALMNADSHMQYVDVVTDNDGDSKFYMLYNEFGDLCCLDGEECVIDHIVNESIGVYDLVNNSGDTTVHFMLDEYDLNIAVFQ